MMKLQSIILVLICGVVYQASCLKLNDLENDKRLNFCGGMFLREFWDRATPSQTVERDFGKPVNLNETWLVRVRQNSSTPLQRQSVESAGFPISQRHVFTSSQVVLAKGGVWALNGEQFDKNITCDENGHFDVPKHFLDGVEVVWKGESFGVVNARIFLACIERNEQIVFRAMLLELSEPLHLNHSHIPCLADSFWFQIEKFLYKGLLDNSYAIYTHKFKARDDRGGPLVYNSSGKAVVLGVKASDSLDNSHGVFFDNVAFLQEAICEFSGVCPPIIPTTTTTTTPTTTTTTTTVPPPSTSPPTQNSTVLESSTQPKASMPPRIRPNPKSNLTDYVETDFEESEKDFKVEVEYVDELDERELEVYFERDKFNGSGGIKKDVNFFGFLLIFGIWRVFWN
ncbi:hypothetical protein B9Z55_012166 [Caenorhabditis nigoni]|uniref:Peptidase S1 domain-containing protein n=1 Tax=Caenorhabditis nigoni TaxID=1611254 RepID=A0A2G5TVZ1_9PELO|nr:hypothetical protein B9Z55_012166 [Caenorhabditis nigoni]